MRHFCRRTTGILLTAAVTTTTVSALPEIAITKRDGELKASERAHGVVKRADGDGTVETNVFDVATWSTGGAYYANGEQIHSAGDAQGNEDSDWQQ